jgi:hypothetical protein
MSQLQRMSTEIEAGCLGPVEISHPDVQMELLRMYAAWPPRRCIVRYPLAGPVRRAAKS